MHNDAKALLCYAKLTEIGVTPIAFSHMFWNA